MDDFDLDNPAPEPELDSLDVTLDATEGKRKGKGKRRLQLRGDVEVDRKKYKGDRIDRELANLAVVVDDREHPDDMDEDVLDHDDDDEEIDSGSSEGEDDVHDDSEVDLDEAEGDSADERRQELQIKQRLVQEKEKEMRRAAAVKTQKRAIDAAIDIRIRLEQIVTAVSQLSAAADREGSSEYMEHEDEIREVAEQLDSLSQGLGQASEGILPDSVDSTQGDIARWRDSVLDLWGRKVSEAAGLTPKGGFAVIDTSISGQLRARLERGEHLSKSRQRNGKTPGSEGDADLHYNDRTLFRSLLHEVIEGGDAELTEMKREHLAKTESAKRKYDYKVSKGKKLKNVVFDKLVGFLAPIPLPDPGPVDEIIASLFGCCNGAIVK